MSHDIRTGMRVPSLGSAAPSQPAAAAGAGQPTLERSAIAFGLELGAAFLDACAKDPELARKGARALSFIALLVTAPEPPKAAP